MNPQRTDLRHRRIFSSPVESPRHQDTLESNNNQAQAQATHHVQSASVDYTRYIPRSQSLNTRLNAWVPPWRNQQQASFRWLGLPLNYDLNRPTSISHTTARTRSTPIKSKMPFLQSITSFFSPSSDHGSGSKRATMNSTFDAFSLPTTAHGGLGSGLRDVVSGIVFPIASNHWHTAICCG